MSETRSRVWRGPRVTIESSVSHAGAWSAAEKGPGKEEGCLSFPNVQPYADAEKDSGEEKGVLSFPSVQQFLDAIASSSTDSCLISYLKVLQNLVIRGPQHNYGFASLFLSPFKVSASQQRGRWGGRRVTRIWTSPSLPGSSQARCSSKKSFTTALSTGQPNKPPKNIVTSQKWI